MAAARRVQQYNIVQTITDVESTDTITHVRRVPDLFSIDAAMADVIDCYQCAGWVAVTEWNCQIGGTAILRYWEGSLPTGRVEIQVLAAS